MTTRPSRPAKPAAPEEEPLLRLLAALPLAVLGAAVRRIPRWASSGILTACGFVLLLSPLALWVSWTPTIFNAVLGTAALALVIALGIVVLSGEDRR